MKKYNLLYLIGLTSLLLTLSACTPEQLTQKDPLQNTAWQWIQYTNNETGEQLEIPTPQNFTLNFSKENQLGLNADCNLVSGTYQLTDYNALTITLGITTEAYCGDDSLDTLYKNALLNSASYIILEDQLLLTLKDDLGQLTFTAAPTK